MQFYKAKWEASTPTKVQVNVPTNTDYIVGTELYVKGQKKDITAENVKLSPSPKQYVDEVITLKYGEDTEWAEWLGNGLWSVKKPFTIKPHYFVKDGAYAENKIYTNIGYGGYYDTTGPTMVTAGSIRTSTGTVLANIRRINTTDAQTYGLTSQYSMLQANGVYASEFTVEEGMQVKALYSGGAWVESDFIFTNKVETGILAPDTTVNGIPAFTMKSLDAEADKLYEVQFTGSNTNVTWDSALSAYKPVEGDLFQYDTFASNKFKFTVLKEITIKAPFTSEGSKYIDLGNDFTNLAAKDKYGNSVFGGELAYFGSYLQLSSATDGLFNVLYLTTSDLNTIGYKKSSNYIISNTSGGVESVTLKPGDIIQINKNSGFGDPSPRFWYFQIGPDAYDYKFKLFINEDEQPYGNIDLGGTTPAEVSAIVDDAITNYDSQLSTVNLSGTFDDDSTFSYNFVIKS